MNERAQGALEALAWVLFLIKRGRSLEKVRQEVSHARDDILQGCSVNFRERIKPA